VVDDVRPGMLLFNEEWFGPVVPLTVFAEDDEAIRLANQSHLGLQAAVYPDSLSRAFRFIDQLRTGSINVNESVGYWEGRPTVRRRCQHQDRLGADPARGLHRPAHRHRRLSKHARRGIMRP
jgi:hypothetical protein